MTTKMQMAFVSSPSVNTKTPLGRKILEIAAVQLSAEEKRIRMFQARKAQEREEFEDRVNGILQTVSEMEKVTPQ